MSSPSCPQELTEEQEQLLKSLEEEFKDRYTENDEGFLATLREVPPLPPIVENWRDFKRQDRSRSRSGHRFRGDHKRRRYEDRNSERYPHDSRYGDRNSERYHHDSRYEDRNSERYFHDSRYGDRNLERYPHDSRYGDRNSETPGTGRGTIIQAPAGGTDAFLL